MNALLLYPEFPDTFWSFKHALKFIGNSSASLPPLGLMTVAAMVAGRSGVEAVGRYERPEAHRCRDLAWAELVMIGGMVVQRDSAHSRS